jgi:sulfatase modifying factor 1
VPRNFLFESSFVLSILALALSQAHAEPLLIKGGQFMMGSNEGMPHERPIHKKSVASFKLDISPVTVQQFGAWVRKTNYQTDADRYGNSLVFDMDAGRWLLVDGAHWQSPLGPEGAIAQSDHPVTQVSWNDANQYCNAFSGRLPTEAEYEYAGKGAGIYDTPVYSFGDAVVRDGDFLINIYTGEFPFRNTNEDGYLYTAPVGETGITPLGLTDMAGNVWEWTSDWYGPYLASNPPQKEKALRTGSFLCDKDVCAGYRTTGRTHSTPDSSLAHSGFRCAYDVEVVAN